MIVIALDADAVSKIRLAPSPIVEVLSWLHLTARGGRHPIFGDPGPAARFALRDRDVALLARALQRSGYLPDLLTPKPTGQNWRSSWQQQVDEVSQAPAEAAEMQVFTHRGGNPLPGDVGAAVLAGTFARRAAQALRRFHDVALAGQWEPIQAALQADLAHRGQVMLVHGLGRLLHGLHPSVRWTGRRLEITGRFTCTAQLGGAELVLVPSALSERRVAIQVDDPCHAYLRYPVSALQGADHAARGAGRHELLGRSRAAILGDLDVPRSTTELSRRHGLALSTISYHLNVLLHAGLLHRRRDGALVRYGRTDSGEALAGSTGPARDR
ncbi:winged helix-turn-helix domain-containing protein [Micromonospora zamorensis]|uniref:winged helix-turn-helix domain-containing protein n=1 Tax=Micromonospora zamorensis TaxID=709883 RepID=UPI0037B34652